MKKAKAAMTHQDEARGAHNGHNSHNGKIQKARASSRGQRSSSLNSQWLRDFLSEMLAVEKGGVKLYQKALDELTHSEYEDKLNEFLRQTERHVELCTEMLTATGADANYQSPGAKAADHKAEGLISTQVPAEMIDLNNIENLVLAETKDHWNWDMLAAVARKIEDAELKRMALKAIGEVRKQEKLHLDWNEKTLSTLAKESAIKASNEATHEGDADAYSR
jgi:rubrerythrin